MGRNPISEPSVARHGLRKLLTDLRSALDLLEGVNDYVTLYDLGGHIVAGNEKSSALIGRPIATIAGAHFRAHIAPSDFDRVAGFFERTIAGEVVPEFETRFLHADGSEFEMFARLVAAKVDGEIVGVYGIATDLRAQRSIERVFVSSTQKFRSLFEHHTDAIVIVDARGRFASINIAAEQLTGYYNEEVVHKNVDMCFVGELGEGSVFARAQSPDSLRYEVDVTRKDGSIVAVEGETIPIIIDGTVSGFFAVSRDITERRRVAAEIEKQGHRIHQLFRVASAMQATAEEQVLGALKLGLEELGFDWAYIARIDEGIMTVTHSVGDEAMGVGYTRPLEQTMIKYAVEQNGIFIVEDMSQPPFATDSTGRARRYSSFVGVPIRCGGSQGAVGFSSLNPRVLDQTDREYIVSIVALASASVERGLHHDRLDALAFQDALTGLPNRLLFMDRLEQQLNFAKRRKRSFAILYVDFDRFKEVNDTYGHAVGDAFLIEMARRFTQAARESDTVARLGGDEFVILQPEITDAENATEFAARLIETTLEPIVVGDVTISPSASIGVSIYPHDGLDGDTLLKNADTALYCVKAAGRNGFALYETKMEARPRPRGSNG